VHADQFTVLLCSCSDHAFITDRARTPAYDFLSLVEGSDLDHAGIIYVQQAGRDIGDVVKASDAHLEHQERGDCEIHYG